MSSKKTNAEILAANIGAEVEVFSGARGAKFIILDVSGSKALLKNPGNGKQAWLPTWMPLCADIALKLDQDAVGFACL